MTNKDSFKILHRWMWIPFFIAILGFLPSYYMRLHAVSWGQHIHGLSATIWFLLIIYQPYLVSKGDINKHRKFGIYSLFVAGLVVASALVMIPQNLLVAEEQLASGKISPIAPPFFLYGVSLFDFVAITGFAVSVLMAIKNSKNTRNHAIWMISTVFWAIMPALARLMLGPFIATGNITHLANIAFYSSLLLIMIVIIVMLRFRTLHIAFVTAILGNCLGLFIEPLGNSAWWISVASMIFKY